MTTATIDRTDTLADTARSAAEEIAGHAALGEEHRRLLAMPRHLNRYGDMLAETLEGLVSRLAMSDRPRAARLSTLLLDVLLAEEGFSRAYWRALARHLKLAHAAGRDADGERALRETLELAAALG